MLHVYDSPQPLKVSERYYKVYAIRKFMGHVLACHQDNTPQTIIFFAACDSYKSH